ncbi:hypothetical protein [Pedobacter sp.]|uniref:hypothetical protein n=1 Tax=Pedobacter sp. TaxID=1411316 RepID=UPI003D7F52D4
MTQKNQLLTENYTHAADTEQLVLESQVEQHLHQSDMEAEEVLLEIRPGVILLRTTASRASLMEQQNLAAQKEVGVGTTELEQHNSQQLNSTEKTKTSSPAVAWLWLVGVLVLIAVAAWYYKAL